jgi:hypothetical protein
MLCKEIAAEVENHFKRIIVLINTKYNFFELYNTATAKAFSIMGAYP